MYSLPVFTSVFEIGIINRYPTLIGVKKEDKQSYEAYMADRKEKREEAFNYPLFLGIVYILFAIVTSYCFL